MKGKAGVLSLATLFIAIAALPAQAQSNGSGAQKTIWDGVYTEAQATRGEAMAQKSCGSCHSSTDWKGAGFIVGWSGRSVGDLHTHLRTTMPFDSPGNLTAQQYTDIVAYMLKLNDVPAGETELPSDDDGLSRIGVTRQASR